MQGWWRTQTAQRREKGAELMEGGAWPTRGTLQRVLESLNFIRIMHAQTHAETYIH